MGSRVSPRLFVKSFKEGENYGFEIISGFKKGYMHVASCP